MNKTYEADWVLAPRARGASSAISSSSFSSLSSGATAMDASETGRLPVDLVKAGALARANSEGGSHAGTSKFSGRRRS